MGSQIYKVKNTFFQNPYSILYHSGTSINDVQRCSAIFDLPTYHVRLFLPYNVQYFWAFWTRRLLWTFPSCYWLKVLRLLNFWQDYVNFNTSTLIWYSIRIFTLVHLGVVYFVHNTPIWVLQHFLDYLWGRLETTNPPKEFLIQMDSKDYLLHHMIPLSHHYINCCDYLDIWNLLKNWLEASDRIPQRFRWLQAK